MSCLDRVTWDWSYILRDFGSLNDIARAVGIEAIILSTTIAVHPLFKVQMIP